MESTKDGASGQNDTTSRDDFKTARKVSINKTTIDKAGINISNAYEVLNDDMSVIEDDVTASTSRKLTKTGTLP